MTTRTCCVCLGAGGILAAGLAGGLAAYLQGGLPTAAAQGRPDHFRYIPADAHLVAFADVRAVMSDAGSAMMGVGYGKGDNRATDAARAAISNPLLDVSIEGAKGVLFNITGGPDLTLTEVHAASEIISKAVDPAADIFFGMSTDTRMESDVKITLIATGFPSEQSTAFASPDTIQRLMNGGSGADDPDLDVPPFLRKRSPAEAEPIKTHSKLPIEF